MQFHNGSSVKIGYMKPSSDQLRSISLLFSSCTLVEKLDKCSYYVAIVLLVMSDNKIANLISMEAEIILLSNCWGRGEAFEGQVNSKYVCHSAVFKNKS